MKQTINQIIHGDCLEVLKTLPEQSVNCCVTSPPYWNLRDYGTASWEGEHDDCNHVESEIRTGKGLEALGKKYRGGGKKQGKIVPLQYKDVCQKCGAKRVDAQLGQESTLKEYVDNMVKVFRYVHRVLRDDGIVWLNLGDSYAGSGYPGGDFRDGKGGDQYLRQYNRKGSELKPKDLCGIPWRTALALQADGWYLRQDIIWHKPNPMPESVKDRCTKAHEYMFLLTKSRKYYFDYGAIEEIATGYDGRKDTIFKGSPKYKESAQTCARLGGERWRFSNHKNLQDKGQQPHSFHKARAGKRSEQVYPVRRKRSVWTIATQSFKKAHFAVMPEKLVEPCILAGCPEGGVVIDPFFGAGTVGVVAVKNNRNYIGIELNQEYIAIATERIQQTINQKELF